jgi:hypothetical protein
LIVKFMVTKFLGRHLSIGWKRGQILLSRLVYIKGCNFTGPVAHCTVIH